RAEPAARPGCGLPDHAQVGLQPDLVGHLDPGDIIVGQSTGTDHGGAAHPDSAAARSHTPYHAQSWGARPFTFGAAGTGASRHDGAAALRVFALRRIGSKKCPHAAPSACCPPRGRFLSWDGPATKKGRRGARCFTCGRQMLTW